MNVKEMLGEPKLKTVHMAMIKVGSRILKSIA